MLYVDQIAILAFLFYTIVRDLALKSENPLKANIDFCPESVGMMLEYWFIERGLLGKTLKYKNLFSLTSKILGPRAGFIVTASGPPRIKSNGKTPFVVDLTLWRTS